MRPNPACAAVTAALAALALGGCGGSGDNKAGGQRDVKPTVLTFANGNGDPHELERFADAVEKRSGGTVQIAFKNRWRPGQDDSEAGLIRDVKAGKADLGWAGTRAFDDVGAPAFDALHAPMLIDSLALEGAVLKSSLPKQMLAELEPAGVAGLGILPGPLRRPLGVERLVRPHDYAGATIAFGRSQVGARTLAALGARGAVLPATGSIAGYDGVEQQIDSIAGNGYDSTASHLTANVALWPRPLVLIANPDVLSSLTDRQRDALTGAAQAVLAPMLALQEREDADGAAVLCRRGVTFETADKADLAALRRAVQPVYDRLDRRPQTKAAIAQIEALRADAGTPPAPSCTGKAAAAQPAARPKRTALDGVWLMDVTRNEAIKEMVSRHNMTKVMAKSDLISENWGRWRFALTRGKLYYTQAAEGSRRWTRADYTVKGHTLTFTVTDYGGEAPHGAAEKTGETFKFHWSRYRDRLTLGPVPGAISPENFTADAWRKVG
jgi:TRAP-type C4-dicarboxylate transport system substrate-binding protein